MYVILFKSPSSGLLYITMYIEIIAFGAEPGGLCSMGAVFGCPRPRPPLRYHPSPCPLRLPSPRPLRRPSRRPLRLHHPPCLAVVGLNSRAWGSFVRRGSCCLVVVLSTVVSLSSIPSRRCQPSRCRRIASSGSLALSLSLGCPGEGRGGCVWKWGRE